MKPSFFSYYPPLFATDPGALGLLTQSMSPLGVKRTWAAAVEMSAFDPKRTSPP